MGGFAWGGSEELWYKTALYALELKHKVQVSVFTRQAGVKQVENLKNLGAIIDKREQTVQLSIFDRVKKRLQYDPGKLKKTRNTISDFNPDVICFSQGGTFDLLQGPYYQLIKSLESKYFIICQHNTEYGNILDHDHREMAMEIFRGAEGVLFVSKRNLGTAQRQLANNVPNARVVSNPVNLTNREIKPFPANSNTLLLACVARLDCAYKGQDLLLDALSRKQWRNRDFKLSLYGHGPDVEYLEELIRYFGLEGKVSLKGHQTDIETIWNDNQLLILPSLSEGTPLALVEAMLCGRCAVATDVGDNARYIVEGETGYLAKAASVDLLNDALEKAWVNKANLINMGINAYHHAVQLTDPDPEKTLLSILTSNER